MRKKNGVFLLLLYVTLILLSGCGGKKNQETENPVTDTTPPVEKASTVESATASLDDIIAALQSSMEANFGENFSLAQDGESLCVDVWSDGLGANANAIVAAGAGVPEQWMTIVNSFQSMAASIQTALDANGYQNISVVFNVLSELDKSVVLLSIVRDTVIYDFLQDNEGTGSPATYDYDALQEIFLGLHSGLKTVEMDAIIENRALSYTKSDSSSNENIAYKIAYSPGVTFERHADSGDYLEATFDGDGEIIGVRYVNVKSWLSAIFYDHGSFGEFNSQSVGDYSGFYVYDFMGREKGIVIVHPNGAESKTNYFLCDSAQDAINRVLDAVK